MKRILVSQEDLLDWMNSQLGKYEECTNCRFTSVLQLKEKDEYGCNWSPHNLTCSGVPAEVCQPIAQKVVAKAMVKFNVKWPK